MGTGFSTTKPTHDKYGQSMTEQLNNYNVNNRC